MKRTALFILPFLCAQLAYSQSNIPDSISYQGRVADASGNLLGDPTPINRTITLRIYGSPTGQDLLYSEQQVVTILKGQFSVLLGTGLVVGSEPKPVLNDILNGKERFLGLTVDDGTPTTDPEISPRQQLVSTAFAMRSKRAESADRSALSDSSLVAQRVSQTVGTSNFDWITGNNLTINGHSKITNQNILEFGVGLPRGGGVTAGQIGYQSYSSGLDILGAVTSQGGLSDRRITMWAEAGTDFKGPISFGERIGQHINLYGSNYGLGIATNTLYARSADVFSFIRGGNSSAGGSEVARLDSTGLTLYSGNFSGTHNGNVINGYLDRGSHGVFAQSYNGGHAFGSQDYTTFSRTARKFSWYLGGSWTTTENDPGNGGTTLAVLDSEALRLRGEGNGSTCIELGYGVAGKDVSSGIIGYKKYSSSLDIVGAGTNGGNRSIKLWAEAGTQFSGPINLDSATRYSSYGFGSNADSYTNEGVQATNNFQSSSDVVLSAMGGRLVADRFTAISDARIKIVKGVSNAKEDLDTLMKVQITDYVKKDDLTSKPKQNKKVIAQQVEEVFPQAVSTMPGAVPDLLTSVEAKAGLITLKKELPTAVKIGDVLKVWAANPQGAGIETLLATVTEVTKESLQFKEPLEGKVFLYGHQVQDLRSVDYEAIAMLNVSATQEMNRILVQQEAEIKSLKEAKITLETQLAAEKVANQLQELRLTNIEKALKLSSPTSVPGAKEKSEEKAVSSR